MNSDGISRKIGDLEERKKLKKILSSVEIPKKMSVIVRTAGIGRSKKEISKDEAEKILKESQKQQLDQELKDQRKPEKKVDVKKTADNKTQPKVKKTKSVAKKIKKVSKK